MSEKWRIRYERVFLRPEYRWSAHKAWSLYYGRKRVARYRTWDRCMEHVRAFYEKFGNCI